MTTTARYRYTCNAARDQVVALFTALGERGVLTYAPERARLQLCVQRCESCHRNRSGKYCTGWVTTIDNTVATFAPVRVKGGQRVQLELFATVGYKRAAPASGDAWEAAPMSQCDVALQILDDHGQLLERHHFDLAEDKQPGPAWHFQYGGNPPNHLKPATHWLDEPRWAVPPADAALVLESIVFNFFYEKWRVLNSEDGTWLRAVKTAEDLTLRHYAMRLCEHLRRRADDREQTWLAAQDNATWNPRPT